MTTTSAPNGSVSFMSRAHVQPKRSNGYSTTRLKSITCRCVPKTQPTQAKFHHLPKNARVSTPRSPSVSERRKEWKKKTDLRRLDDERHDAGKHGKDEEEEDELILAVRAIVLGNIGVLEALLKAGEERGIKKKLLVRLQHDHYLGWAACF